MQTAAEHRRPFSLYGRHLDLETPELGVQIAKNTCITLGDMHGNAYKLAYLLAHHGYFDAHPKTKIYPALHRLAKLYQKKPLEYTREDFVAMETEIDAFQFKPGMALRLLGDLLADRGMNDVMTLLLLKRLVHSGIDLEIIFSNHDAVFLQALEAPLTKEGGFYFNFAMKAKNRRSSDAVNIFIQKGFITPETIRAWIDDAYKPFVKLISCMEDNGFTMLFSHAPIDETQFKIFLSYSVREKHMQQDIFKESLAKQVQASNQFLSRLLISGTLSEFVGQRKGYKEKRQYHRPFSMLFDSRCIPELQTWSNTKMIFICGHTSPKEFDKERLKSHFFLNNRFGKFDNTIDIHGIFIAVHHDRSAYPNHDCDEQAPGPLDTLITPSSSKRKSTPIRMRFFGEREVTKAPPSQNPSANIFL